VGRCMADMHACRTGVASRSRVIVSLNAVF